MRISRSRTELIVGIIVLIILAIVSTNIVDDRLSKQLDNVDLTYEEAR